MSAYIWAGIAIVILFLLVRLAKWWRAPETTKQDQINLEKKEAWWNFRMARWHKRDPLPTPTPIIIPTTIGVNTVLKPDEGLSPNKPSEDDKPRRFWRRK
jgi:hypothetical protein